MSQLLQAALRAGASFEAAAATRVDQGIPLTAAGNIAYGAAPITYYHQGLPFNAAGQLAAALEGVVSRVGNGGAPFNAAGLLCISVAVADHVSASIKYTAASQVTNNAAPVVAEFVTNEGEIVTNNGEPVTNG